MYRYPDGSGLVGYSPGNRLADPPSGIRTELVALGMVKLLDGFNQAHVPFLDEVQEQHAAAYIPLGNTDYQTEIGFRQPAFGFFIAVFDPFGQTYLIFCGEQRHAADFLQIHPDRVIDLDARGKGQVIVEIKFIMLLIVVGHCRHIVLFGFIAYLYAQFGELLEEIVYLFRVLIEGRQAFHDVLISK
ncbi:hypothetical protein D3C75_700120 [compost metagenome]